MDEPSHDPTQWVWTPAPAAAVNAPGPAADSASPATAAATKFKKTNSRFPGWLGL